GPVGAALGSATARADLPRGRLLRRRDLRSGALDAALPLGPLRRGGPLRRLLGGGDPARAHAGPRARRGRGRPLQRSARHRLRHPGAAGAPAIAVRWALSRVAPFEDLAVEGAAAGERFTL